MTTSVSTRAAGALNPTRRQLDELDALLQRMLELPVNKIEEEEQAENDEMAPPAEDLVEEPEQPDWCEPDPLADADPSPIQPEIEPIAPAVSTSYFVVETATPRVLPPASGFEPRPPILKPLLAPATPAEDDEEKTQAIALAPRSETPAPAGESEAWVPLRSTWQPSPQTWPPLADSWNQSNGAEPGPDRTIPIPSTPIDLTFPPAPEPLPPAPISLPSEDIQEQQMPTIEPRLSLSAEDAPHAPTWTFMPLLWFNRGFDACLAPLGAPGRWLSGPGRQAFGFVGLACLTAAAVIAVTAGLGWTWWTSLVE